MVKKQRKVWLGLGSNQGDAEIHFRYVLQRLKAEGCIIKAVSALYQTPPWGKHNQADFTNACIMLKTVLSPRALLHLCLQIEQERGRKRHEKWGPRSLDLDILLYENYESRKTDKELVIPHPYMAERAFVLLPLHEIDPALEIAGKPLAQIIEIMHKNKQTEGIKKLEPATIWAHRLID